MCVCEWVCSILLYIFVFAVYLLVLHMCAPVRVWSCLVTDNFGLFTEIAVCTFLCGLAVVWPKTFLFCPLYLLIHFSASFYTAHCSLDLARDHVPWKCPLFLIFCLERFPQLVAVFLRMLQHSFYILSDAIFLSWKIPAAGSCVLAYAATFYVLGDAIFVLKAARSW